MASMRTQQYEVRLAEACARARARWPWLPIEEEGEHCGRRVRVGSLRIAVRIDLRLGDGDWFRPLADFSSATAPYGSLAAVESVLREYRDVLDATYEIMASLNSIVVHPPTAEDNQP